MTTRRKALKTGTEIENVIFVIVIIKRKGKKMEQKLKKTLQ